MKRPIAALVISFVSILLIEIQQGIFVNRIFSYYYQEQDVILSNDITIDINNTKEKDKKHQQQDSNNNNSNNNKIINFHTSSNNFIKTLSSCFINKDCHVIYHHIGKTGGTNVESRFFNVFPFHPKRTKMSSCCSGKAVDKFNKFISYFCSSKFTAFQVRASQFDGIVSQCMDYYKTAYEKKKIKKKQSLVILASIREPASRTLSNIHQLCNKNLNRRDEELKKACSACDYEKHPEAFDKIVQTTNKDYLGIVRTVQLSSKFSSGSVKSLTLDTDDIDSMFTMLQLSLSKSSNYTFPLNEKKNPEKHSRCNFGMKSTMFKNLAISREIYRNITAGLY